MIRSVISLTIGATIALSIAPAQMAPPKIILLVGPPGSGKTTQAKVLAQRYGIPAFSMSDLIKKEMRSSSLSKPLAATIASGDLLPDGPATELIRLRLFRADLTKGFILDGYPSTAGQAKALDQMLQEKGLPKAVVVVLDAPDDVIRKRMVARQRADDKPEIIDRRIREFRAEAAMLAGWAGQTHVVRVNSNVPIGQVSTQIVAGLEDAWSKQTFAQRP
jgi:adenylate kinase